MTSLADFAVKARKFLVAVGGAVTTAIANGLLSDEVAAWVNTGIALLTAALVFLVPNGDVVARETPEGETVAAEASPLPNETPVVVTQAPEV